MNKKDIQMKIESSHKLDLDIWSATYRNGWRRVFFYTDSMVFADGRSSIKLKWWSSLKILINLNHLEAFKLAGATSASKMYGFNIKKKY